MSKSKLKIRTTFLALTVCIGAVLSSHAQKELRAVNQERSIDLTIEVNAPVEKVWDQWATKEGISKFFAPSSRIELKPLGHFDIYFFPSAPEGQRGAEENLILGVQEKQMLSFTWDAPAKWPEIRKQRTFVTVRFHALGENTTKVTLTHTGWGSGGDWDVVRAYFQTAWGETVLPFLKYSLEVRPVDWTDFPKNLPTGLKPAARN